MSSHAEEKTLKVIWLIGQSEGSGDNPLVEFNLILANSSVIKFVLDNWNLPFIVMRVPLIFTDTSLK